MTSERLEIPGAERLCDELNNAASEYMTPVTIRCLATQARALRDYVLGLQRKIAEVDRQKREQFLKFCNLGAERDALEAEVADLRLMRNNLHSNIQSLANQLDASEAELAEERLRVKALQVGRNDEAEELRDEITHLRSEQAKQNNIIARLREVIRSKEEDMEELEREFGVYEEEE